MNGIEKIIAHIEAEAAAECRAIEEEASRKSEEIRARYEQTAADARDNIVAKGQKDAETYVDRMSHVAALEAKKQLLAAKQELVSLAFDRAVAAIRDLPEADYTAFLMHLAADSSQTGTERIILSEQDRAAFGDSVCDGANSRLTEQGRPAGLTLSDKTRAIRGGLILERGDIEVNCSIDTLIAQHKNRLASKVAAVLFDS